MMPVRYDLVGTLDADISMLPPLPFNASGMVEFRRR
jgi:hypothetical protein